MDRNFEPNVDREMELELEYEPVGEQVVVASASKPMPNNYNIEREVDLPLAPILYFFTSPKKPGIKLIDRSPQGLEAELTGTPGIIEQDGHTNGIFDVDPHVETGVKWDSDINIPNRGIIQRYYNGSQPVFTFIVSAEEMANIQKQIREATPDERGIIRIIVHDLYGIEQEVRFYRELYSPLVETFDYSQGTIQDYDVFQMANKIKNDEKNKYDISKIEQINLKKSKNSIIDRIDKDNMEFYRNLLNKTNDLDPKGFDDNNSSSSFHL